MKSSEAMRDDGGRDFLAEIVEYKKSWVAQKREEGVEGVYRAQAIALPLPPSFHDALRVPRCERAIIAEIKRRSPSRGDIHPDLDASELAAEYTDLGASALSVLTDERFFGGGYEDLLAAAQATSLPILCKDFIIDPLQITMARAHGASAVLLIATLLGEHELRVLYKHALDLGLDVLVEVHSAIELEVVEKVRIDRAGKTGFRIIGVNARDLRSFEVDDSLLERLAPAFPDHVIRVAESGVSCREDVHRREAWGYDAMLVGEALCGAKDRSAKMRELAGEYAPNADAVVTTAKL